MKSGSRGLVRGMGRNLAAVVLAVALIGAVMPLAADEGEIVWGASIPLTGIYAQAGAAWQSRHGSLPRLPECQRRDQRPARAAGEP